MVNRLISKKVTAGFAIATIAVIGNAWLSHHDRIHVQEHRIFPQAIALAAQAQQHSNR